MLSTIVKTTLHLPRKISAVCWITFWSWFGMYNVYSCFLQVHQLIAFILEGWSPFFGAHTPRIASHAMSQRKSNMHSLRYHLGRRDILPPERRQRCRLTAVYGNRGTNSPKRLYGLRPLFGHILRQLRLPAFLNLLALGRRSPKSSRKRPADC